MIFVYLDICIYLVHKRYTTNACSMRRSQYGIFLFAPIPEHVTHLLLSNCLKILMSYLFLRERERDRERKRERESKQGRGRERGRHRSWSWLQVLSCQHRSWRGAWTCELQNHDLSWSWTLNLLSHPGAPIDKLFKTWYGACKRYKSYWCSNHNRGCSVDNFLHISSIFPLP